MREAEQMTPEDENNDKYHKKSELEQIRNTLNLKLKFKNL